MLPPINLACLGMVMLYQNGARKFIIAYAFFNTNLKFLTHVTYDSHLINSSILSYAMETEIYMFIYLYYILYYIYIFISDYAKNKLQSDMKIQSFTFKIYNISLQCDIYIQEIYIHYLQFIYVIRREIKIITRNVTRS